MEITQEQGNKRDYAELRPWQFKPGQSGNPGGRPKGTISLKQYAKKYLEELDEEGKLKFMEGLDKNEVWRMAEGNPENKTDITSKGESIKPDPIYGGKSTQDKGHNGDTKDIQPQ